MARIKVPHIIVSPPGPKSKAVLEKDQRYISWSYSRPYPAVIERGEGAVVWDVDGNTYLDFNAGIAVCSTGHCHPEVVQAIQNQATRLIHMSGTDFYYSLQVNLAEKLAEIAPGSQPRRVFFANSGTEAVECAIKLARYHTGRPNIIACYNCFHGRTMGALALTASKGIQRNRFGPFMPGVFHIPYADCLHCARGMIDGQCCMAPLEHLEKVIFKTLTVPEEVAAIVVETIQGEGGYIVPPPEFHPRLKALAEKYGILYIVDEIQSGMGRTGKMFAIEHWGVNPDVITLAKGIASGLPLGATIANADLMTWDPGSHASTFGGNPVACAASLATIRLLQERYMENARCMGEVLFNGCQELAQQFPVIGDVRGKGLMIGVEIVSHRDNMEPAPELRDRIVKTAFKKGLLVLGCGPNTVRLAPPLVITEEQVHIALSILQDTLQTLQN